MDTQLRAIFRRGRKVNLRPLNKQTDLASCLRWLNDPDLTDMLGTYLPITEPQESAWLDKKLNNENNISLAIETTGGRFIGIISLNRINWKDRCATTGSFIGDKALWGRGYGSEAKMMLLNFAFNTLGLNRIESEVIEYNTRSQRCLEKCGYRFEGCRRKCVFKNGLFWNLLTYGILRDEWEVMNQAWKKAPGAKATEVREVATA